MSINNPQDEPANDVLPDVGSDVSPADAVQIDTGRQWRRLAPVAIIYFVASSLKKLVQFGLYAIPAIAISFQTTSITQSRWFLPVLGVVCALIIVNALLDYLFYQFRVRNSHVEIKSGVFHRRHINLPFWRIQNVKIERPVYYRLSRFAVVILDTAGSANEEASIVAVTRDYAAQLRAQILNERSDYLAQGEMSEPTPTATPAADERIINTRSIKDLVLHGITNNRVWILLGAMAPFFDELADMAGSYLGRQGLQLEQIVGSDTIAWWQWSLYLFTVLIVIMAIMGLLSVGGALLTYYGYTLSKVNDRYIRRSGLLSQQEVSMRQSRVQVVTIKQDWLDKLLRRANVFFEQNKTGHQPNQELMAPNKLLVPSVTCEQAKQLAADALPGSQVYPRTYSPITRFYLLHNLVVRLLPIALLLGAFAWYAKGYTELALVGGLTLIVMLIVVLRYWRWGYAIDDQYLYVRTGCIGIDYQILPLYKLQQVVFTQSLMMKRRHIASVKLVLASGSVRIVFLPESAAQALVNRLVYETESTSRSWM